MVVSYQLLLINIDITLTISDSKVENIHTDRVLDSTSIKGLFFYSKIHCINCGRYHSWKHFNSNKK